jgi:hypothetical protein
MLYRIRMSTSYSNSWPAAAATALRHKLRFPAFRSGSASEKSRRGVTIVEAMVSLLIMGMFMAGFLASFIQSRRVTEASVLHAAATSVMYGIIEQIKGFDYDTALPYTGDGDATNDPDTDPNDPLATLPPFVRVRINQSTMKWLKVRYTQAPDAPLAPASTDRIPPNAAATAVGGFPGAIDNWIGAIPLSTVTGSASQDINLNIWVWIDEIQDANVSELKRITIVYTYQYRDGGSVRTMRNREVFLRSRYDQ